MSVGRAEAKVHATQTAGSGGQDAGGVTDHLNSVRHTMPIKEGGEDGTGGADLLRLAEALAHEPPNTTIRVTLRRVMVGDKARERAEPGAEGEVQGVAAVAKVGSKDLWTKLSMRWTSTGMAGCDGRVLPKPLTPEKPQATTKRGQPIAKESKSAPEER